MSWAAFQQSTQIGELEKIYKTNQNTIHELQNSQQMLEEEIYKLNDVEYILKIARKEYFFSKEGEIIFILPEINQNE